VTRGRLIVNPSSGTDRGAQLLPAIQRELGTLVDHLDTVVTTSAEHAEHAAASVMEHGMEPPVDALYVAGGDGTLNAVLRGLVAAGGPSLALPIGIIPVGTGNDFAKALGLGEEPDAAIRALLRQQTVDVDLGMLNGRPFVNTSAGGFVADASEAVTEGLKDKTGKLAYLIGGARALLGSEPFTVSLTRPTGDAGPSAAWSGQVRMFAVCNARFIGGGYPIAPAAAIDDGLLDVLIVPDMPVLEFVAVLQRLAAGAAQETDRVLRFRAPSFELAFDRRVRVNTDGEVLEADRCSYHVRPKATRFFCGEEPHVELGRMGS
jgi:diacylglycerol kinase (ATP)